MSDFLNISARLGLDTSEYDSGLRGAVGSASSASGGIIEAFAGLASGVASVLSEVYGVIEGLVSDTASLGDTIDKQSQKLGISTDAYQEWGFILQHCGTDIGTLKGSMRTLTNAVASGSDEQVEAFEKIGLSIEELAGMSQEDIFDATIRGLQGMEAGADRSALATKLLGRNAAELAPLLNTSAEETENMKNRVHELGGVMDKDGVKAGAAYEDSLLDMQTAMKGIKTQIGQAFLPAFKNVVDWITENMPRINEVVSDVVGRVSSAVSTAIDFFNNNLAPVLEGIIEFATDTLYPAVEDVFVNGIVPIVSDAFTSISGFVTDTLIPAFQNIVSFCVDNLFPKIQEVWNEWIVPAISGAFTAIQTVWENVLKPAFTAIWDVVANTIYPTFEEYWPMISGFVSEAFGVIQNVWNEVLLPVFELIGNIISGLKSVFETTWPVISGAVGKAFSVISGAWSAVGKPVFDAITSVVSGLIGLFNTLANAMKNFLGMSSSIQGAAVRLAEKAGTALPNGNPNQYFASGGVVTRGGYTLVGERGAEIVELPAGSYVNNARSTASGLSAMTSGINALLSAQSNIGSTIYRAVNAALKDGLDVNVNRRNLGRLVKNG